MGPQLPDSASEKRPTCRHILASLCSVFLLAVVAISAIPAQAQSNLPFEVSNLKNRKWSPEEATRIYSSACDLLARTVRPENPPQLHPKLLLVLGAEHDEYVRGGGVNEVRLKLWDPEKFAEAVVLGAVREMLRTDDLKKVARESVSLADATVSPSELKGR